MALSPSITSLRSATKSMRPFSVVVLLHAHGNHGRHKSTNRTYPSVSCQLSLLDGSYLSIKYSLSSGPCGTIGDLKYSILEGPLHLPPRESFESVIKSELFTLTEDGCVQLPKIFNLRIQLSVKSPGPWLSKSAPCLSSPAPSG